MWLKQAISQYSNQLSTDKQPRPWNPMWIAKRGVSSADASRKFQQGVMVPLVQTLNRDLKLTLQIRQSGGAVPHFQLVDHSELFGTVYMANPLNGRAFFRYPNGLSVEIHSYRFLLEDMLKRLEKNQIEEKETINRPRGLKR